MTPRTKSFRQVLGAVWVRGPEIPKEWEGKRAWVTVLLSDNQWLPVDIGWVPKDFPRDEESCGSVFVALIEFPDPPELVRTMYNDRPSPSQAPASSP